MTNHHCFIWPPAAGANPCLKDSSGQTPLHLAVQWGNKAAIRQLLAAGADPNALDNQDISPLYLAALSGNTDITAVLLAAGAKTQAESEGVASCCIPLVAAAKKGHVTAVKTLLAAGADASLADNLGCTPMQAAAACCSAAAGVALLAAGAEVCDAWLEDAGNLKALWVEVAAQEVALHKAVGVLRSETIPSIRRNLALLLLRFGLAAGFRKDALHSLRDEEVAESGRRSARNKTEAMGLVVAEDVAVGEAGGVAEGAVAGEAGEAVLPPRVSEDQKLTATRRKTIMECAKRIQQLQEEVRELEQLVTPAMQEAIVAVAGAMSQ